MRRRRLMAGVDIVCAQGGEGGWTYGGYQCEFYSFLRVWMLRGGFYPPMLGGRMGMVVAAGGIYDGRGLAASLMMGAVGVWVGTRFVASEEAGCSRGHKEAVVGAGLVVSGRPLRVRRNDYIKDWEGRGEEIRELVEKGVVPMEYDMEEDRNVDFPYLMGVVAALINDIKPAKDVVDGMVREAIKCLTVGGGYVGGEKSIL